MTITMILMSLLLLPAAIEDLCSRRIHLNYILLLSAIGLVYRMVFQKTEAWEILADLLPGIVLYILSVRFRGIGAGDSFLFLAAGIIEGFPEVMNLLGSSMFLCFLAGCCCYLLFPGKRGTEIPAAPFILAAYMMEILL